MEDFSSTVEHLELPRQHVHFDHNRKRAKPCKEGRESLIWFCSHFQFQERVLFAPFWSSKCSNSIDLAQASLSPGKFEMSPHCREDDDDGGDSATKVPRESIDDNPTRRYTTQLFYAWDAISFTTMAAGPVSIHFVCGETRRPAGNCFATPVLVGRDATAAIVVNEMRETAVYQVVVACAGPREMPSLWLKEKNEKLLKPRGTYPLYLGVFPNDSAQHCSNMSPWTRLFTPIVPRRSLHISFY